MMYQKDRVKAYIQSGGNPDIGAVSEDLLITRPQVRRIFGELTREGFLTKVSDGDYAFTKAAPTAVDPEDPKSRITDVLEHASDALKAEGLTSLIEMHEYPNGSIDAWLKVPYQRDMLPEHILIAMEESVSATANETDFFTAGMFTQQTEGHASPDFRNKGRDHYITDFRVFTSQSIVYAFLSARQILKNLRAAKLGIPDAFFVWVRHLPDGSKPRREFRKKKG